MREILKTYLKIDIARFGFFPLQLVVSGLKPLVDDLTYTYTGNKLTGLSEAVSGTPTGDVYSRGSAAPGTYTYDNNGNMITDSRKGLTFTYNFLNLLNEVRSGATVKARYTWLADGTKLRVRDAGSNGFDYLGSLTYTSTISGLQLETARFSDGIIRMTGTTQEVHYFLTDHLGSVRVIADATGAVKERNDYYAFGAKHVRSNYPQNTNRYDFNAKEEQTTGDLKFLDYGARMYDNTIGRWFNVDPAYDSYYAYSPFHFTLNNPLIFLDYNGTASTHYVDDNYNILLQTNDGSDNVVVVPEDWRAIMRYYADNYKFWALRLDDPKWNQSLFSQGFVLADKQFREMELLAMDMQTTDWSRNLTAAYFLNPTFVNAMKAGFSEIASQWMDPYRLVAGANIVIAGVSGNYINPSGRPSPNVTNLSNGMKEWLGSGYKPITTPRGYVFLSNDGLRKIRFDIKGHRSYKPHGHFETFKNGRWVDAPGTPHHLYFNE